VPSRGLVLDAAGGTDKAATDRLAAKVGQLTAPDPVLVRQLNGRVDVGTFWRESRRKEERIGSGNDGVCDAHHSSSAIESLRGIGVLHELEST
jgi:hypothetical protein